MSYLKSYLVWRADNGEDASDGVTLEGTSPQDAAEQYASRIFTGSDPFDTLDVLVHATGDTRIREITIDVIPTPTFEATATGWRPCTPDAPPVLLRKESP